MRPHAQPAEAPHSHNPRRSQRAKSLPAAESDRKWQVSMNFLQIFRLMVQNLKFLEVYEHHSSPITSPIASPITSPPGVHHCYRLCGISVVPGAGGEDLGSARSGWADAVPICSASSQKMSKGHMTCEASSMQKVRGSISHCTERSISNICWHFCLMNSPNIYAPVLLQLFQASWFVLWKLL